MKMLYLDESGDHNLSVIDPQYPVFVLGGVILDSDYIETTLDRAMAAFKDELFGRRDIVLHTADIARNRNGFEALKDGNLRGRFFERLNDLMRSLDYKVVACAIRKDAHLAKHGLTAVDPYMLSVDVLVERFWYEIGRGETGCIIAERRGPVFDQQLELAWSSLKIRGTNCIQASRITRKVEDLKLMPKSANNAGLQLADLVVSPIGRHVIGKPTREDFRIIESKFRRRDGDYRGCGLVVLPKQ